ncbi:MAG: DUF2075 domain-containing protein [Verrucomicrobia bacterium]|nr:DUF2075 domain-containing protein [Verrucomicrobiota bacterium]
MEAIARFDAGPPPEHIVIFDEAQRAWDKPHAIDIRVDVDPVQWFLNDREDI